MSVNDEHSGKGTYLLHTLVLKHKDYIRYNNNNNNPILMFFIKHNPGVPL